MTFQHTHKNSFFIAAIILLLINLTPYFIAAFYSFPQADDFCWALLVKQNPDFFRFLNVCYTTKDGRFITNIIMYLSPTNTASLSAYQFSAILLLTLFTIAIFVFSRITIFRNYKVTILFTLLLVTLSLSNFPNLSEAIYWLNGAWNYTFGTLIFFIMFASLYQWHKTRKIIHLTLTIITYTICTACTELHLMVCFGLLFVLGVHCFLIQKQNDKILILIILYAIVTTLIFSFAPGNFNRFGLFPVERDYSNIILMSLLNIIRFSGLWIINPASIAVGIFILLFAKAIEPYIKFKAIPSYSIIAFMAILMLSAVFVPTYISGIIGQHRTVNAVLPIFLCCWFLLLFQLSLQIHITHPKWLSAPLLFAFFWLSITFTGNHKTLLFQLADGTIQKSFHEQLSRQTDILNAITHNLDEVKPMSKKSIIVNYDITPGKWSFMNVCQQEYAKEIGIVK